MSEVGSAIAAELKAAQASKLKKGVSRIETLQDQLADIGTAIKSEYKTLEDAGLDKRVVKECIKRGKRDDRQIALFDMTLLQYEATLGRQRKMDLAPPESEEGEGDDGEKVASLDTARKAKGKGKAKGKKAAAEPARAAAAEAAAPQVKRGAFKDVTPRMSAAEYRQQQGIEGDSDDATKH